MNSLDKARKYEKENRIPREERPLFHVTPPVGWMNDPNGFSVYQGKIHLFYQYHPYSKEWGPMHWGHQVTKDLIKWKPCPIALAPDMPYDEAGCFSGSAIETEEGHVLIYTGVQKDEQGCNVQNQCIAIGDGVNYKKIEGNPVVTGEMLPEGYSRVDFRDPKVWEENGIYYMLTCSRDEKNGGNLTLFSSPDLRKWKYEGVFLQHMRSFGSVWECPDYFVLDGKAILIFSPPDMQAKENKFHNGNNALCMIGDFDGERRKYIGSYPVALDFGFDFYAPQTTLLPDGRRVMIAWMQSWHNLYSPESQKWQGMMTLPRELSIRNGKLIQQPVRELAQYHKYKIRYANVKINGITTLVGVYGRTADIIVEIHEGDFREFCIELAKDSDYHTRISYFKDSRILEIDRTYSGMNRDVACVRRAEVKKDSENPSDNVIKLRIILDCQSMEVFVNDGEMVLSTVICTPMQAQEVSFFCDGEAHVSVEKYEIVLYREKGNQQNSRRNRGMPQIKIL